MTNQYNSYHNSLDQNNDSQNYESSNKKIRYTINRYDPDNENSQDDIIEINDQKKDFNYYNQEVIPEIQQEFIENKIKEELYKQRQQEKPYEPRNHFYEDKKYQQKYEDDYSPYENIQNIKLYPPKYKKNKAFAIISTMVVPGVGHGYLDKWRKGVYIFVSTVFCVLLSLVLYFPLIIAFIIYIYAIIDIYHLTDMYNAGYKI